MSAYTAMTRFGLGPTLHDVDRLWDDPRGTLLAELDEPPPTFGVLDDLPDLEAIAAAYLGARARSREVTVAARREGIAREAGDDAEMARSVFKDYRRHLFRDEVAARVEVALATDRPLVERLVLFFTNHFAVARSTPHALALLGHRERTIRPLVLGRFRDLLEAAVLHPMMLIFLDNIASTGPNSPVGRRRNGSINENLARELLELHTLGVNGGYTQADVEALALVLTGWTGGFEVARRRPSAEQRLGRAFDGRRHEPGPKTILGRTYPEAGEDEIRAVLDDLAAHPATARHVAGKLARHFVGDGVSEATVAAMTDTWLATDGDLRAVMVRLIETDEAWAAPRRKVVPPYDFIVSALRAFDRPFRVGPGTKAFEALGYTVWNPPSPAGWPDGDRTWIGGDMLLERIDWANDFAVRTAPRLTSVEDDALDLLGEGMGDELLTAIRRAEDRVQALTLLLMSPQWQVR
jgi:uncharacterized protein (DUF1800 family)